MTDQRLYEQTRHWPRDPQEGEVIHIAAKRLKNAADIGILQPKRDLNSKEAERYIPQAPKALTRLFHAKLSQYAFVQRGRAMACAQWGRGNVYEYLARKAREIIGIMYQLQETARD